MKVTRKRKIEAKENSHAGCRVKSTLLQFAYKIGVLSRKPTCFSRRIHRTYDTKSFGQPYECQNENINVLIELLGSRVIW